MRVDTGVLHFSRSGVVVTTSSSIPFTIRFGVFELDPRAGELRKKSMKIRPRGAERNPVVETRATRSSPAPSQSRGFWTLILSLALEFLSCPLVQGQSTYGAVAGSVTDPSGAALVDAQVMLTNLGTSEKRTQSTVADGLYSFVTVIPGQYRVEVEKQGLKRIAV